MCQYTNMLTPWKVCFSNFSHTGERKGWFSNIGKINNDYTRTRWGMLNVGHYLFGRWSPKWDESTLNHSAIEWKTNFTHSQRTAGGSLPYWALPCEAATEPKCSTVRGKEIDAPDWTTAALRSLCEVSGGGVRRYKRHKS